MQPAFEAQFFTMLENGAIGKNKRAIAQHHNRAGKVRRWVHLRACFNDAPPITIFIFAPIQAVRMHGCGDTAAATSRPLPVGRYPAIPPRPNLPPPPLPPRLLRPSPVTLRRSSICGSNEAPGKRTATRLDNAFAAAASMPTLISAGPGHDRPRPRPGYSIALFA